MMTAMMAMEAPWTIPGCLFRFRMPLSLTAAIPWIGGMCVVGHPEFLIGALPILATSPATGRRRHGMEAVTDREPASMISRQISRAAVP